MSADPARDNESAARTCLILLILGAVIGLIVCAIVLLAVAPFDLLPEPTPRPADQRGTVESEDTLLVAAMEVGQGECIVVITPDGRSMVIDGGRSRQRMEERVVPYLREHGVERVDYVVTTNPDQDHVAGLERLLELLPVGAWVDPVIPNDNQAYARSLALVEQKGIQPIRARRGLTLDLGPAVTVEILWPVDPLLLDGGEPSHNDNSVVLKITHGEVAFIVPGDIERDAEQRLVELDDDNELQADVLVLAHHGSRTSSTAAFLDAVSPHVALIPVGLDNQYGHPHDEVLQRLRFRDIAIYRTDLDGTIEVISDGNAYQVRPLGAEGT